MRKAVQVDDDQFFKVQEKLAQLEVRTATVAKDRSSWESPDLLWTFCVCMSRITTAKKLGMGSEKAEHDLFIFEGLVSLFGYK